MPIITPAETREHIETDLSEAALERLIHDAETEIVRRHGPHRDGTQPASVMLQGGGLFLFVRRPIESVVTVTEERHGVETELAQDDFRLWYGGAALERLHTGTNPQRTWGDRVVIGFQPVDDTPMRVRVVVDLVRLAIAYNALRQESLGVYSRTSLTNYQAERDFLVDALYNPQTIGVG